VRARIEMPASINRYLDGLPPRAPGLSHRSYTQLLWCTLVGALGALYHVVTLRPQDDYAGFGTGFGLMACAGCLALGLGLFAWNRGHRRGVEDALHRAHLALFREDYEAAVAESRAVLRRRAPTPTVRASALATLGEVARARGDFAEAVEVYVLAGLAIDGVRGLAGEQNAPLAAVIVAGRAFCLAALGRAEECARCLAGFARASAPLSTRAVALCAEAQLHSRAGAHARLAELLAGHRRELQNQLFARHRLLLAVLAAHAEGRAVALDADAHAWVVRAAPHAAAAAEVAA
jgi:hypothetical protein